jgi:DNA polymerase-3 subunit epsilon
MNAPVRLTLVCLAVASLMTGLVAAGVYAVWVDLDPARQALVARSLDGSSLSVASAFALIFAVAIAMALYQLHVFHVGPVERLTEDLRLMLEANPEHRAASRGSRAMQGLARTMNAYADAHLAAQRNVKARIDAAGAQLEDEKSRLAALMSELTMCVIVCNRQGRILLYNQAARRLFGGGEALLGLGRSIHGIAPGGLIAHAQESLGARLAQGQAQPVTQFVLTTPSGALIRTQMAPVMLGAQMNGFVLTMEDVTESMAQDSWRDVATHGLMEATRGALGNVRAAIETLLEYPDMTPEERARFSGIIRQEAESLSTRLEYTVVEFAQRLMTQWPLEQMLAGDLVSAVQHQLRERHGIASTLSAPEEPLWIKAESHSALHALLWAAHRIHVALAVDVIHFVLAPAGRFVQFDIGWDGPMIPAETTLEWENHPLLINGEGTPLTLRDVAQRHGSELWFHADRQARHAYLRLLLPASQAVAVGTGEALAGGRPEFYDFDLFSQPGQTSEQDERPLAELTYTVFDTETTGLDPGHGDEIISIGAVRVVNRRLLRQECFQQLIDPRRPVSPASTAIHGITDAMLAEKPTIARVLPAFAGFAEDTVLVGHNAAFDLRFLQLKEQATGIRFIQPVLDTLLLSAVLHPNQEEHSLEAIAARLGVTVSGRHSAMGDAMATAEIFLKMLPLLSMQGINTLREAREASQQTYFARIRY